MTALTGFTIVGQGEEEVSDHSGLNAIFTTSSVRLFVQPQVIELRAASQERLKNEKHSLSILTVAEATNFYSLISHLPCG